MRYTADVCYAHVTEYYRSRALPYLLSLSIFQAFQSSTDIIPKFTVYLYKKLKDQYGGSDTFSLSIRG